MKYGERFQRNHHILFISFFFSSFLFGTKGAGIGTGFNNAISSYKQIYATHRTSFPIFAVENFGNFLKDF